MKINLKDINKKGFAVLHGKWGGSDIPQSIIGLSRNQKNLRYIIGYLAYPNVGLRNTIPERMFFGYEKLIKQKLLPLINSDFRTSGRLEQSVTKSEYVRKIKQIKELLAQGEIYQMCYCIRFRKRFKGNPYALFQKLISVNPTDYSAYLNCGDFQIISNSPEHFFKVQNRIITTNPIKGTISKKNEKNLIKLLESDKERAELDMITDLERNDVGKICEYGTLKLNKERNILELKNLWHTYSEVQGKLRPDVTSKDVISAMFPGGSIIGCPKRRAMEYISKLEGLPRNIFTGSIGFVSNCGANSWANGGANSDYKATICPTTAPQLPHNLEMNFNIAIRTALVKNGMLEFWAGGGIVADSNPEKEYEECHLKAERFLDIIKEQ